MNVKCKTRSPAKTPRRKEEMKNIRLLPISCVAVMLCAGCNSQRPAKELSAPAPALVAIVKPERKSLNRIVEQPGSILSRESLLNSVWTGGVRDRRVVDSAIWKLRQKLGEAGGQIETIVGFGYRFNEPGARC